MGPVVCVCVCIYIYLAECPIWGHLVVWGQVNAVMEVRISEWRNGVYSWGSRKVVRGGMPHRLSEAEVRRCGLLSRNNVLGNSIDKDTHHESTRKKEVMKYLKESCYHRIECSAANSLAALMWKWYLNRIFNFQLLLETSGMCWWDRDQHQKLGLHVEGGDERRKIV